MRPLPSAVLGVFLASFSLSASLFSLSASPALGAPSGDANGDGAVTVADGVQVLRAAHGLASACGPAGCDLDGDGRSTVDDGIRVLRRATASARHDRTAPRRQRSPRAVTTVEVHLTFTATTTLQGLQIEVGYPLAKGGFQGSADAVACSSNGDGFFFANDLDDGTLVMNQASPFDLSFPFEVTCRFDQSDGSTLAPEDLTITIVEVVHDGAPGDPATLLVAVGVSAVAEACSPAPHPGCRRIADDHQATVLLQNETTDGRDQIAWRFLGGEATPGEAFGNPLLDTGYALCIYDATPEGITRLVQAEAPSGGRCGTKPCWHASATGGFVYRSPTPNPDGLTRIQLTPGAASKARIVVKGLGPNLRLPSLPTALPLTVQLQSTTGLCWEATYEDTDVQRNDATRFRATAR